LLAGLMPGPVQPVRQCSESSPPRVGPVVESGVAHDAKAVAPHENLTESVQKPVHRYLFTAQRRAAVGTAYKPAPVRWREAD